MNKHFLNFISFIPCCLQLILFRSYKYLIIEFNIKDLEVYTFNLICYHKQDEVILTLEKSSLKLLYLHLSELLEINTR